jgi:hypothetical protein
MLVLSPSTNKHKVGRTLVLMSTSSDEFLRCMPRGSTPDLHLSDKGYYMTRTFE